jgi:fumarylpyruvate hydrolase
MNFVFTPPVLPAVPVTNSADKFPVHRIYCVGRNYADHAIEMGGSGREAPFFFMKPADAVVPVVEGTVGRMRYPTLTHSLHHEVELVIAIGVGGRGIPDEAALQHVWGYAVGLDMTRRDLQNDMKKQGRPWCIGKGFEQSAPVGPIVPAAQCQWGPDSEIALEVNRELRQQATLGRMIWSVPEIIAQVSSAWTLAPGDLIFTGTPAGVAAVSVGDRLSARIDGVGTLAVDIIDTE